jgi:hypothetical protein
MTKTTIKSKIDKDFLYYLEFFYRNFGSEWTLDEFPNQVKKHKEYLLTVLPKLADKEIIKLNKDNSFIILKLPSKN